METATGVNGDINSKSIFVCNSMHDNNSRDLENNYLTFLLVYTPSDNREDKEALK